ncbi:MAG: hypothetical protein V3U03_02090 [Myxococcota bacterium]
MTNPGCKGCGLWLQSARRGAAAASFDERGLHGYLVRPDHLVFGVALTPDDVAPLLADL